MQVQVFEAGARTVARVLVDYLLSAPPFWRDGWFIEIGEGSPAIGQTYA
jgi:hypothetical protein